ncbi:MAG: hypothetical protein R2718_00155 [Solirubrobacterales bacterium]|nr:hypothetical protein [Solirubrobacterales bacterium]
MRMNQLGKALALSAALMLVAAIVVALAVEPLWGLIVGVVALTDLVLAVALGVGVIGTPAEPEPATYTDPAGEPGAEDGYGTLADGTPVRDGENPLARED